MAKSSFFTARFDVSISREALQHVENEIDAGTFASRSHAFRVFMLEWFRIHRPSVDLKGG